MTEFNNDVYSFLKEKPPELDSLKVISYSTLHKGMAIPVNDSYNILEVKDSEADYLLQRNSLNNL